MKTQFLTENIIRALKEVKGYPFRKTLPVVNCAMMAYGDDGYMRIYTTDLETFTDAKCGCRQKDDPVSYCVPLVNKFQTWPSNHSRTGYPLLDWLKATPDSMVEFDYDENTDILTVTAGRSKATFNCLPAAEFPPIHNFVRKEQ